MMRKCTVFLILGMACAAAQGASVSLFVDAAPNVYGSSDYAPWKDQAFAKAADGTFVNMANSVDPANVGTTNFHLEDEVVYSFGDLGKRLTWIYWVPGETISSLQAKSFETSLENVWDGDVLDFYDYYYGETWLEPTKWEEYDVNGNGSPDGVIGTAGMAWWGAYNEDTQEALDEDLQAWRGVDETWTFTARLTENGQDQEFSILSERAAVPEPLTMLAVGSAVAGLGGYIRRRRRA